MERTEDMSEFIVDAFIVRNPETGEEKTIGVREKEPSGGFYGRGDEGVRDRGEDVPAAPASVVGRKIAPGVEAMSPEETAALLSNGAKAWAALAGIAQEIADERVATRKQFAAIAEEMREATAALSGGKTKDEAELGKGVIARMAAEHYKMLGSVGIPERPPKRGGFLGWVIGLVERRDYQRTLVKTNTEIRARNAAVNKEVESQHWTIERLTAERDSLRSQIKEQIKELVKAKAANG
jgi:hypothetical protein